MTQHYVDLWQPGQEKLEQEAGKAKNFPLTADVRRALAPVELAQVSAVLVKNEGILVATQLPAARSLTPQ